MSDEPTIKLYALSVAAIHQGESPTAIGIQTSFVIILSTPVYDSNPLPQACAQPVWECITAHTDGFMLYDNLVLDRLTRRL